MRRKTVLFTGAMLAGVCALAAGQPAAPDAARSPTAAEIAPEIVATVNGKPLTRDQLAGLTIGLYGQQTLGTLISQEVVRQEAARLGVSVTPEEIDAYVRQRVTEQLDKDAVRAGAKSAADLATQAGKGPEAIESLRQAAEARIKPFVGPELLARKLMARTLQVRDAEVKSEFNRRYGAKVKVQQIVLRAKDAAEEVLKRLQQGADFAQMARDVSIDRVSKRAGGEMDPMPAGAPLADAAFKLKPGQVSGVIELPDGDHVNYHIVRLIERLAAQEVPFEEVKESLRAELLERLMTQQRDKWLDELLTRAEVKRTL